MSVTEEAEDDDMKKGAGIEDILLVSCLEELHCLQFGSFVVTSYLEKTVGDALFITSLALLH